MNPFGQSIVRLRGERLRDSNGILAPQVDPDTVERLVIDEVSVQPARTVEARDEAGVEASADWEVFSRPGVILDLIEGDRAEWDGVVYDVVGQPQSWPGHHSEIRLRRQPMTRTSATSAQAVLRDGLVGAQDSQVWTP